MQHKAQSKQTSLLKIINNKEQRERERKQREKREHSKTIEKIDKTKDRFFEKINKIDELLASLIRKIGTKEQCQK